MGFRKSDKKHAKTKSTKSKNTVSKNGAPKPEDLPISDPQSQKIVKISSKPMKIYLKTLRRNAKSIDSRLETIKQISQRLLFWIVNLLVSNLLQNTLSNALSMSK